MYSNYMAVWKVNPPTDGLVLLNHSRGANILDSEYTF